MVPSSDHRGAQARGRRRQARRSEFKIDELEVKVDPRAEWEQIFNETWRIQRDFLYDPHAHGLDLHAAKNRFQAYLPGLGSRHGLDLLMEEMLGELCLGHVFISGGDTPKPPDVKTGLLGADYKVENDRYQFAKIYRGEAWNPDLRAPLLQPGAGVNQGEYLFAINGKELKGTDNVYRLFEGTADKQTIIKVGPNADGSKSARGDLGPDRQRASASQPGLGGQQPQEGRGDDGRQGCLHLCSGHFC